jgi:hypothetical protein
VQRQRAAVRSGELGLYWAAAALYLAQTTALLRADARSGPATGARATNADMAAGSDALKR